jgi:hypothetical protein
MPETEANQRAPVQGEVVKILRSVNRRDFSIEPAGYFNVLRPSTRFTPAHPPGDFRYLPDQSKGTTQAYENSTTAPPFQLIPLPDQNVQGYHRLLRPALIVLAATALTLSLVWWSAGCPIHVTFWLPPQ